MATYKLIAPCHFGMEAVLKKEILRLGYEIIETENGKVAFAGDEMAICRANIMLRTAERVLLEVARFKAYTFDDFFEGIKKVDWSRYIPENGRFWIKKATSINSKLFSPSDLQRLGKKAMVDSLGAHYGISRFEEDGEDYPVRVNILKDVVSVCLDTTGDSLHKRGYRTHTHSAPISETLAAAILLLSPWNKDRHLIDPFCGSGTIAIEAAMIGMNMAPGMNRSFTAEKWTNFIPKKYWYEVCDEAMDNIDNDAKLSIQGYDIDPEALEMARANAEAAGVDEVIHFQKRDIINFSTPRQYGFVITNPPYGERIGDDGFIDALYSTIGNIIRENDTWSFYILTGYDKAVRDIGKKADKNRKIYNGMLKTYLYQYMGKKPPKRNHLANDADQK